MSFTHPFEAGKNAGPTIALRIPQESGHDLIIARWLGRASARPTIYPPN
jgi:hypothetical protein